jgi:hypothetical protein
MIAMGMHDSEMISISSLLLLWFPFLFYFLHPFGPTGQGRILGSFFFPFSALVRLFFVQKFISH